MITIGWINLIFLTITITPRLKSWFTNPIPSKGCHMKKFETTQLSLSSLQTFEDKVFQGEWNVMYLHIIKVVNWGKDLRIS